MSKTGTMTSDEFYTRYQMGDISIRADGLNYYRNTRVYIEPDDDLKQRMIDRGWFLIPKIRRCLQCDEEFESLNEMRRCKLCKASTSNVRTDETIYENGQTL